HLPPPQKLPPTHHDPHPTEPSPPMGAVATLRGISRAPPTHTHAPPPSLPPRARPTPAKNQPQHPPTPPPPRCRPRTPPTTPPSGGAVAGAGITTPLNSNALTELTTRL